MHTCRERINFIHVALWLRPADNHVASRAGCAGRVSCPPCRLPAFSVPRDTVLTSRTLAGSFKVFFFDCGFIVSIKYINVASETLGRYQSLCINNVRADVKNIESAS